MFVAFVGLNNNTILALQNIEFGSVSSDRYPDPAENASIEAIPILNIASAHPYSLHTFIQIHVHINVMKRLYNISLSLIYHAAQSIMGRISGQSILIHQHSFTDDPFL